MQGFLQPYHTRDSRTVETTGKQNEGSIADDHRGHPVFLARNAWHLDRAQEDWPDIRFVNTKEQTI